MARLNPLTVILLLVLVRLAGAMTPTTSDTLVTAGGPIVVEVHGHASFRLDWAEIAILVDPVGDASDHLRDGHPRLILITHRHGDHFAADLVRELASDGTVIVAPQAVAESIPDLDPIPLAYGQGHQIGDFTVTAIPAYNTTAERQGFHPRGRGNGYVLERLGVRVSISGDTEDVPELAEVGPVDAAFLCMNLPWTMSVDQAARAVAMLQPTVLYPYHYRHRDGRFADLDRLEALVGDQCDVRRLAWY